jgi:hypothetical protein
LGALFSDLSVVVAALSIAALCLILGIRNITPSSPECTFIQLINPAMTATQDLVNFLLAGFVVKIVTEWREQRVTYQKLHSEAANFTSLLCATIQVFSFTFHQGSLRFHHFPCDN